MSNKREKMNKLATEFNKLNDSVFFADSERFVGDLDMDKYCWEQKCKYFVHYYNTHNIVTSFTNMDDAIDYLKNELTA